MFRPLRRISALLVACMVWLLAQAEPVTLPQAVAQTVRSSRVIQNAYLTRLSQKFDLRVAEDAFNPKLLLGAQVKRSGSDGVAGQTTTQVGGTVTALTPLGTQIQANTAQTGVRTDGSPTSRTKGWAITLTQPLLRGAGTTVNTAPVEMARLAEQANILNLKATIASTLNGVIAAYRAYVLALQGQEIARQSLARAKELMATNRELIAAGRMAALELVQSESEVANREFSLLAADNAVDTARLALARAIDRDRNQPLQPLVEEQIPPQPLGRDDALRIALENRVDYQTTQLSLEQAQYRLALARDHARWDLALVAGVNQSLGNPAASGNAWNAGLNLSIPIGDLTLEQAQVQASTQIQQLQNDLARQREGIAIDVETALQRADMNYRQIALAKQARRLSEQKVAIETERLKVGRSTNFQLVSYQNDLVAAQNNEQAATINYLNALTELDNTLGITLNRWGVHLDEHN